MCLSYAKFQFQLWATDGDSASDFTNLENSRGDRQSDHMLYTHKNHNECLEEKVHGLVSI